MLEKLNSIYPVRYTAFIVSVVLLIFTLLGSGVMGLSSWWPSAFSNSRTCALMVCTAMSSRSAARAKPPSLVTTQK